MNETAELAQLIELRWKTLERLLQLTLQQSELIANEEISDLLPHLSAKQQALVEFAGLQQQLRPFAAQPASARDWESEAQRQQCQQWLDESDQMLAEIVRLDQECESTLVASRDQLAQRMEQSVGSQRAISAYLSSDRQATPSRLDLSSGD